MNSYVIIHNQDGTVAARSRNLRGILDRARKLADMGSTKLSVTGRPGVSGILHCQFPDGSWCDTYFAAFSVAQYWIDQRVKLGRGKFEIAT